MGGHVVTGAFNYTGSYIATRLVARGEGVHTLANSPNRANPFGGRVTASLLAKRRRIVSVPPAVGVLAAKVIGAVVGDVFLTRDEVKGLVRGLLATGSQPTGTTRLSVWARVHADTLGLRYSSELARRRDRLTASDRL